MPEKPNYYQMLELSPDVDDLPTIEKQISVMGSQWSQMANQGFEGERRRGAVYMNLVPLMRKEMKDPAIRQQHRERELRRRDEVSKEAMARLDGLAKMVLVRSGGYTDADLTQIVRQLGAGWDEKRVRKELERRGVSFAVAAAPKPARETLDPTLARTLRDELIFLVEQNELKQPDLYELLGPGFDPGTSCDQLRDEADQQEKDLRRRGKTDQVSSARLALLGHCRTLLGDPVGKVRYDNYRATRVMEPFEKHLHLGAGSIKVILPRLADEVVAQAAAQGIPAETARQFIEEFAIRAKFNLLPREKVGAAPLQCGFCYHMATSADAAACHHCGKPFRIVCPNPACKTHVPTQDACCRKCGYTTGNASVFFIKLEEAKKLLRDGDLEQAGQRVEVVLRGWPDYPEAVELRKQIQEQAVKIALAERDLRVLLAERKGEAMRQRLAGLRGPVFAIELQGETDRMIADARRLVEEGRRIQAAGRGDDAIDRFEEALRTCADFADARLALSACLPNPPTGLEATLQAGLVMLRWRASPSRGSLRYRVVRKAGSAPRRPEDGTSIDTIDGVNLTDPDAPVGESVYYAVYTERGGVPSASAALAGPVFLAADVTGVRALARDGCVELSWNPLPTARQIEVWRKLGAPPARRGDGTVLNVVARETASDGGLPNGRPIGYRVVAVFRGPDGQPLYASGATVTAIPVVPPKPITDLTAFRAGDEVEANWSPPVGAAVVVFVNAVKPEKNVGDLLTVEELKGLGQRLLAIGPGQARGRGDPVAVLYFTPVSIIEGTGVVGLTLRLTTVEEVAALRVRLIGGRLVCHWDWPSGIRTARVAWRRDCFPAGPIDRQAQWEDCNQFHYDQHGGFSLTATSGMKLFLTVYAATQTEDGVQYSSGTASGARREVPLLACNGLSYRLRIQKSFLGLFGSGDYELRVTPEAEGSLPALVFVVRSGEVPLDREDGTEVLRIPAGTVCSPRQPLVEVISASDLPRNPKGKLFPENPDDDWLDLRREP